MEVRIMDWNGNEIPDALKNLPPGRYVIEPLEDVFELTPEQEDGILQAMDEVEAGRGVPFEEVLQRLRAK